MAATLIPDNRRSGAGGSDKPAGLSRWRLRMIHSLAGALPLSALMVLLLWWLAKVSAGPRQLLDAWRAFAWMCDQRWLVWPAAVALAFHAGYGLRLLRARAVVARYPQNGSWLHLMQRISAVGVAIWLGWQLIALGWPVYRGALSPADAAEACRAALSSTRWGVPWLAFGYLMGLSAALLHLFHGLWLASLRWGVVRTQRARSRVAVVLTLLALAVLLITAHSVIYLATGWRAIEPGLLAAGAASSEAEP